MNKISILALLAMSSVGITHADNWTGFYAGVNGGLVFSRAQLKSQQLGFTNPSATCNTTADLSNLFPGIQLGYMYQLPNYIVTSLEANATFNTDQNDTLTCSCLTNPDVSDRFTFKNKMQSTIKGRVGRALDWQATTFLPYLTVGASFANLGLAYKNEGGDHYSKNTTQAGWLLGAGMEWIVSQNWSLRAEYFYADYGNALKLQIPNVYGLIDPNGKARIDLNSHNFVVAVNYWI